MIMLALAIPIAAMLFVGNLAQILSNHFLHKLGKSDATVYVFAVGHSKASGQ